MNQARIEQFLYREARLLDEQKYGEWLQLWGSNLMYWVPCGIDDYDPEEGVSIIYDNRARLERRVERMSSPWVLAQEPKTQMRRQIANVEIREENEGDFGVLEVTVSANFVVYECRRSEVIGWAGNSKYLLRPNGEDGFLISRKISYLINRNENLPALPFLL